MPKKKKRQGKWSPIRFKSTWREYRYGGNAKPKLPQIFKGDRREAAVQGVLTNLRDWRLSPFEHEGECRAGVRQTLCLAGHGWTEADTEAAGLISESLRRVGAERPDWEEGQWHYAVPRENCARCAAPIDDADQARGFRYCSDVCARAYKQHLSDEIPWDHELRRMGYWQMVISAAPVKTCPTCSKSFKSVRPDAVFCSPECLGIRQRQLQDKPCKWCKEPFRPKDNTKVYCSMACRDAHRVNEWKTSLPPVACVQCSTIFRPTMPKATLCSKRCAMDRKNAMRNAAYVTKGVRQTTCLVCQKDFEAKKKSTIVCSPACAKIRQSDLEKAKRREASAYFCEAAE